MAKIIPIKVHPENRKPVMPLIEITGAGDLLCYDETTGRWFRSSKNTVNDAVNYINELIKNNPVFDSLNSRQLLDCLGLHPTNITYQYGWRVSDISPWDELYSTKYEEKGFHGMEEPVLVISAVIPAIKNYNRTEEEIICDERV